MSYVLENKKIIVTGVASGIGQETAKTIKSLGGYVIGVDRNKATNHVDEFHQADLSDKSSIDQLVAALPSGANGLANIAGLPPTAPAELVVLVNLVGLKYLTESLLPKLADGASIVNLASLAGFGWSQSILAIKASANIDFADVAAFNKKYDIGSEGGRSYFFSKEALVVWTMQNRWTWRDRGIRMNAVSPGPVETPILKDFLETLGDRAEEDARVMDRPGSPGDIAPVVCFLLSDMATWMRGSNIPVDGGMSSHILCGMHEL